MKVVYGELALVDLELDEDISIAGLLAGSADMTTQSERV